MFFIPRKKGESVVFGDDIILTVIEIRGDKVRLGVEHPRESQFTGGRCTRRYCRVEQRAAHGDAIDPADRRIAIGGSALDHRKCHRSTSEAIRCGDPPDTIFIVGRLLTLPQVVFAQRVDFGHKQRLYP